MEHPDNPENLIEVTPETFKSAMARTRQDYELSHGKQPNARMEGMSAKGGFHKKVMANNGTCDPNGKDMNKWTQSVHWCTNESSGTPCTANGAGYEFLTGKTVLGGDDGAAFDKRGCGIADMEREAHDLADSEGGEEGGDDEGKAGREHGVGPGAGARATRAQRGDGHSAGKVLRWNTRAPAENRTRNNLLGTLTPPSARLRRQANPISYMYIHMFE